MRFVIGFAVLIAALTAAVELASAQNRPWCLRSGFSGPGWCGFDSFQQCMASASGQGGSCIENNMLVWQRQQEQQKKNARRQRRQDDGRWTTGADRGARQAVGSKAAAAFARG